MLYRIMLFTSLLCIIANDNDKPGCIFLILKDIIMKKMLTYEDKMNQSSNYMLLTRKVICVDGNVYIRSLRKKGIRKCDKDHY